MSYFLVKNIHVGCVMLSLSLFALRGGLQLAGVSWRRFRLLRILPHAVDTVLLASALWLASQLHQYPFVDGWLTAKLLGLLAYIGIGMQALKPGLPVRRNLVAYLLAFACAAYIVGVAVTHSPSWGA